MWRREGRGEESEAIEALQSLGKRGKKMETRKEEDLKGMAGGLLWH